MTAMPIGWIASRLPAIAAPNTANGSRRAESRRARVTSAPAIAAAIGKARR